MNENLTVLFLANAPKLAARRKEKREAEVPFAAFLEAAVANMGQTFLSSKGQGLALSRVANFRFRGKGGLVYRPLRVLKTANGSPFVAKKPLKRTDRGIKGASKPTSVKESLKVKEFLDLIRALKRFKREGAKVALNLKDLKRAKVKTLRLSKPLFVAKAEFVRASLPPKLPKSKVKEGKPLEPIRVLKEIGKRVEKLEIKEVSNPKASSKTVASRRAKEEFSSNLARADFKASDSSRLERTTPQVDVKPNEFQSIREFVKSHYEPMKGVVRFYTEVTDGNSLKVLLNGRLGVAKLLFLSNQGAFHFNPSTLQELVNTLNSLGFSNVSVGYNSYYGEGRGGGQGFREGGRGRFVTAAVLNPEEEEELTVESGIDIMA